MTVELYVRNAYTAFIMPENFIHIVLRKDHIV